MVGHFNECSALFKTRVAIANYHHCASHELNFALSWIAKVSEISYRLSALTSVGSFFNMHHSDSSICKKV